MGDEQMQEQEVAVEVVAGDVTPPAYELLSGDEFIATDDVQYGIVPTPELKPGSAVRVKSLTARERAELEQAMAKARGKDGTGTLMDLRERICARTVLNPDGTLAFTNGKERFLGRKNAAVLERIAKEAFRLSGIGEDSVKEMVGNSEPAPSDAS